MARIYISNDPSGRVIPDYAAAKVAAGGILKKNIGAFQNRTEYRKR
jgi:hypothetical protein